METKLHKAKIVSRLEKVVKHFIKEAGPVEAFNFNVQWPLKIL